MLVLRLMKYVSVEPVLFSASLAIFLYAIIANQYIYFRIAKDHGVDIKPSNDSCAFPSNVTTNRSKILEEISAESSDWILYTNLAGLYVCLISLK